MLIGVYPRELVTDLSSRYTDMVALGEDKLLLVHDSVTAWGHEYVPDWVGAMDIEVNVKNVESEQTG